MPFGELELVAVRIADPGAQAHTIGPLFERADEGNSLFFEDRGELPEVARVDADVTICGCHLGGCVLASLINSRNGSLALSPYPTKPTSTLRARVPVLHLHAE
jgi:hypothetical protein